MELFDETKVKVILPDNRQESDLDETTRSPNQIQADIKAQRSKPGEFYMTKPYNAIDASK